jgi:ABC-type amino acid transport system permease subunit
MPTKQELPTVEDVLVDRGAGKEATQFAEAGKRLDLSLRKWAGRVSLTVAIISYIVGILLAVRFACMVESQLPSWHVVIAILVALFTVPTVLVLAVLRSASLATKDADADSLHAVIGTKVMNLIERLLDKSVDTLTKK